MGFPNSGFTNTTTLHGVGDVSFILDDQNPRQATHLSVTTVDA